jgi:hypothetical protein
LRNPYPNFSHPECEPQRLSQQSIGRSWAALVEMVFIHIEISPDNREAEETLDELDGLFRLCHRALADQRLDACAICRQIELSAGRDEVV